jgi:hypothetical protein
VSVTGSGGDLDVAAGGVVVDGVLDEVADEPFEQARVAVDRRGFQGGVDGQFETFDLAALGVQDVLGGLREVAGFSVLESGLGAGEREQPVDQVLLLLVVVKSVSAGGEQRLNRGVGV